MKFRVWMLQIIHALCSDIDLITSGVRAWIVSVVFGERTRIYIGNMNILRVFKKLRRRNLCQNLLY